MKQLIPIYSPLPQPPPPPPPPPPPHLRFIMQGKTNDNKNHPLSYTVVSMKIQ